MLPPYQTMASLTWRQYLSHFDIILYGHIVFSLPVLILAWYLKGWFPLPDSVEVVEQFWPNLPMQLAIDYGASFLTCITVVMVIVAMQRAVKRQPAGFGSVLSEAWSLYPMVIVLSVIEFVWTLSGLAVLVIPGILISVCLAFAIPIFIWYRTSPWQAIQRSIRLVQSHFWVATFYILLTQLLVSLVVLLITWGLPTTFWFNVFSAWLAAICASYYTLFTVILLNMLETIQTKQQPKQ